LRARIVKRTILKYTMRTPRSPVSKVSVIIPRLPDPKYDEITSNAVDSYRKFAPKDVHVFVQSSNNTFAANVNIGLKVTDGDYLVVSNNDVIALPGWYEWITKSRRLGIVSLTPKADCGWGFMIPRKLYELVGGLNENLENSYEDYDLFMRCALLGYSRILAPKIFAVHQGGVTINDIWGKMEQASLKRLETCRNNQKHMLQKWPDFNFDAVPTNYFALNEVEIMKDWKRKQDAKVTS